MGTPVSFGLSKVLKEKGFRHFVVRYYLSDKVLRESKVYIHSSDEGGFDVELNEFEENYNDGAVGTKSGNRCYGCNSPEYMEMFSAPTIDDVVRVIFENTKLWIGVFQHKDHSADVNDPFVFRSNYTGNIDFETPDEAYEAAILCVVNNYNVF